jgi:hypothetical protein
MYRLEFKIKKNPKEIPYAVPFLTFVGTTVEPHEHKWKK